MQLKNVYYLFQWMGIGVDGIHGKSVQKRVVVAHKLEIGIAIIQAHFVVHPVLAMIMRTKIV